MWKKANPSALLVGTQTGAATVVNSTYMFENLKSLQKTKHATIF